VPRLALVDLLNVELTVSFGLIGRSLKNHRIDRDEQIIQASTQKRRENTYTRSKLDFVHLFDLLGRSRALCR